MFYVRVRNAYEILVGKLKCYRGGRQVDGCYSNIGRYSQGLSCHFASYEDVRGSEYVAPLFLNLDIGWIWIVIFMSQPLCPGEETTGTC